MQLYIHVPFCRSRCRYCSFFSQALPGGGFKSARGEEMLRLYLEGLLGEIVLWADRLGRVKLETVFFGGGTPSLLPIPILERIMGALRRHFILAKGAELSLEANPDSLLEFGYAAELVRLGFNRLSLGVQSLDDDMLAALGRPHNSREALIALDTARVSGFANVGMDLIWGLPGQRTRLWLDELKTAVSLKPQHLSCYSLTLEEGTVLARAVDEGKISLPAEKEQSQMFAYGSEYLAAQGYLHYEISNFALMGFKCRHNLGYWEGRDYLGLGPAASSTIGNRRWSNAADLAAWSRAVKEGSIAHDYEELDKTTRVLELIMLRLRTDRGLRLQAYRELTGRDFIGDNKQFIHALHGKGMVRIRGGYLSLTDKGMLVSDSILGFLFDSARTSLAQLPTSQEPLPLSQAERGELE
ncbi:MAG: radical SAM family heme chaperone HemW [Deltaproteobacteria bacterium]|jgi:oxygen-independent coproporphyrinogen-3 oxidase|nr:radical SAM family heme chaperone HemW [Deltaproteobacteria bacterium]